MTEDEEALELYGELLLRADRAREDAVEFFGFVMEEERTRRPVRRALPHQRLMLEFVLAHPHCVVKMPPGTSKTFGTASLAMWLLGSQPTMRGAVISGTQEQAEKPVRMVRDYVESSARLRMVFPDLRPSARKGDPWTQTALTVARPYGIRDPSLVAVGFMGGSLPGSRLSWILVDDLLNEENTSTPEAMQKVYNWVLMTVRSRLDSHATDPDFPPRIVVTNTPYHPKDLVARLEAEGWPALTMRASGEIVVSNTDWDSPLLRPAWPGAHECRLEGRGDADVLTDELLPREKIEALRRDFAASPGLFRALYECDPRDDASAMCKEEFVEKCKAAARARGIHGTVPRFDSSAGGGRPVFTGVDLAFSEKSTADSSACFTFYVEEDGTRVILDVDHGKWDPAELMRKVIDKHDRYGSILCVENNGAQDMLVKLLRAIDRGLPVKAYTTGKTKANPVYGVPAIFAEMANGAWAIPNDARGRMEDGVEQFVRECLWYSPKKHTGDVLMACLAPGALVTTARGLVPIEGVCEGDSVLTHKGRWRRVTGTTAREYAGDIHRVKASGMIPFLATPNHPVWRAPTVHARRTNRFQPGRWDWERVDGLRPGSKEDYVLAPVPRMWPGATAGGRAPRLDLAQHAGRRLQAWGGRWSVGAERMTWRGEKSQPRWLSVDEDAAMLLGLFVAEGCVAGKPHQAVFSFHEREAHLQAFVAQQASRLFAASTTLRRGSGACLSAVVNNAVAARFFAQIGKRDGKALPWEWMAWPLRLRLAVVRGWLMGDGCIARTSRGNRQHLSGVSVARAWLEQARLTLAEAGLCPSLTAFLPGGPRDFGGVPGGSLPSWKLSLSESDTAKLLRRPHALERVHWAAGEWRPRERTNSGSLPWRGDVAVRLKSTEAVPYSGLVYNLHVEEDESFVANGVAVHNCFIAREIAKKFGVLGSRAGRDMRAGRTGPAFAQALLAR